MIDLKEQDIIDILNELSYIPDEEGNLLPNYCFASDINMDLDCTEEEVAIFALKHGYKCFKVFPGETMLGGIVLVPDGGTIEPVEKMYKDFYGEVPEISEMKLEEDKLIVLDESHKSKKKHVTVRDPNAAAMWGRTRSQTYKQHKGRGSFTRKSKHKGIHEDTNDTDFEASDFDRLTEADSNIYKKEFEKLATDIGATIEWKTDIYPCRQIPFWYGDVCAIHYKGMTVDIFTNGWGEFQIDNGTSYTRVVSIEDAEELGIFTDEDIDNSNVEWVEDDGFFYYFYKDEEVDKGTGTSDLDWDIMYDLEGAIDLILNDIDSVFDEASEYFGDSNEVDEDLDDADFETVEEDYYYIPLNNQQKKLLYLRLLDGADDGRYDYMLSSMDVPWAIYYAYDEALEEFGDKDEADMFHWRIEIDGDREFELVFLSDGLLDEIKNLKEDLDKNYLKLLAKKHKKTDKKGAMGWFKGSHPHGATLIKDAGNVELNVAHFNNVMGGAAADGGVGAVGSAGGDAGGCCEDLEDDAFETKSPYEFTFHSAKEYSKMMGYWDEREQTSKSFWATQIPETAMKVGRDDFMTNKLLRKKKNLKVFKGVKDFFEKHPTSKWCIIEVQDPARYGKFLNVYRVLMEHVGAKKQNIKKIFEAVEKHDTLNPKLFDENNKLLPEVREKLLEIAKEFTDGLEQDEIKFNLKDIKLVGSNCSYNYNPNSDIDLHLEMETKSLKCPDNLYPLIYSAYRSLFNGKLDPVIHGIPVEIFVETDDTEQMNDEPAVDSVVTEARQQTALKSNGIYSVMNDEWIKEPVAEDIPELDQEKFNALVQEWEDRYQKLIGDIKAEDKNLVEKLTDKKLYTYEGPIYRFKRYITSAAFETRAVSMRQAINNLKFKAAQYIGYDRASGANVEIRDDLVQEIEEDDGKIDFSIEQSYRKTCPHCGRYLNDADECPYCDLHDDSVLDESVDATLKYKIEEIDNFIEDVYDLRKSSIRDEGEYGLGNLVFKEMRNRGYLDNLRDIKNKLRSKELSLY